NSVSSMRSARRFFSSPIRPSLPSRWAPCSCPSNSWSINSSENRDSGCLRCDISPSFGNYDPTHKIRYTLAIRGERGSYNLSAITSPHHRIVAIRGERGSYNADRIGLDLVQIVAIRGERGSYNRAAQHAVRTAIVAIRGERGSYN